MNTVSESGGVWVFSENLDLVLELLGKGRELADGLHARLTALSLGSDVQNQAQLLVQYGADRVLVVDDPLLKAFGSEPYLSAVAGLAKEYSPDIILIGSTRRGKELAARLATRLETGCIPDSTKLSINDQGNLTAERTVYGGSASAKMVFKTKPQIATVPPRTFERPGPNTNRCGEIVQAQVTLEDAKTEISEIKPIAASQAKIEEAKIVVCGGRGIQKREDFGMLEELAHLLDGQVSNSRPLAEDRKWFNDWVGLSGHKIKPRLYVGCGVSGVIQHLAGIRDSQVVVAINRDPDAPICEAADYVVVGDLYLLVPALIEALKRELKRE